MKIVQLPEKVLREKAQPVKIITPKIILLINKMITTLNDQRNPSGVGLAAPQVGQSLQIFIVKPPPVFNQNLTDKSPHPDTPQKTVLHSEIELFINPKIISSSGQYKPLRDEENLEGCLSLHGYFGMVKRANTVTVAFETFTFDQNTKISIPGNGIPKTRNVTKTYTGFPAVIIQHELDHLNGTLFIDRILEQKGKLYKVGKDTKGKEVLDVINI